MPRKVKTLLLWDEPPGDPPSVDDFAIACDSVHLERMDDGVYWLGVYKGGRRIAFYIGTPSTRGNVRAVILDNDFLPAKMLSVRRKK